MDCYTSNRNLFNNRGNTMDKLFKIEHIGAFFIIFGILGFFGIVGFVEGLTTITYTDTIEIGIRVILFSCLILFGVKIYNGK
jgi:hypothetical protein